MQKATSLAVLIGGLLLASTAFAQQAAPIVTPDATQQKSSTDDPNEIVCHAADPILGSRFPGPRVCRTRGDWLRIQRESQSVLFHEQMERSSNCAGKNSSC
jgi:hypothetical protein